RARPPREARHDAVAKLTHELWSADSMKRCGARHAGASLESRSMIGRRALTMTLVALALTRSLSTQAEDSVHEPARVATFSPQGVVRSVRQVSANFSEPMVALGDPRSARDPFAIDCPVKGASRWADERSWVYTFEHDLPAGLRCRFTLHAGARTLSGAALAGPRSFGFSTGGPAVLEMWPLGRIVAEDQHFALRLDAEADSQSVERHAFFRVSTLRDPVGVRVVTGPLRDALLESMDRKPGDPLMLVLAPRQHFAPDAKVVLHWVRGVATRAGVPLA